MWYTQVSVTLLNVSLHEELTSQKLVSLAWHDAIYTLYQFRIISVCLTSDLQQEREEQ